jgi:hypothetical protein
MAPSDARLALVEDIALFGDKTAKARYGLAYLRSICSQAGVGFTETSPDEDVYAVDADVKFPEGTVSIQVKCTGGFRIGGKSASWKIEPEWRDKWNRSKIPVYFVLVMLDPDSRPDWVTHTRREQAISPPHSGSESTICRRRPGSTYQRKIG